MKRTLRTVIIFRFTTSSSAQLISSLERCLDSVADAEAPPLHWSFPLHFLLKDSSVRADRLVERLRERPDDRLIPTGFSGAYHSLLSIDELSNEVRWSMNNPWGEDTETGFGVSPVALFPSSIDLLRMTTRRIYREAPGMLVASEAGDRLFIFDRDTYHALPVPKTATNDIRAIVRQLKRHYRGTGSETVALVVDGVRISAENLSELVRAISETARKRRNFSVVRVDEATQHLPAAEVNLQSIFSDIETIPTDPSSRIYRATAGDLKRVKRRNVADLTKRRLERLAPFDLEENQVLRKTETKSRLPSRTIIADMYGEVTLSEADLSVRFSHGRLTGLRCGDIEMLPGLPAESRMIWRERSLEFTTMGAFSFEEERCRGLRTSQKLDGVDVVTPGQVTIDYSFADGRRDLQVAVEVSYPELRNVEWIDEYALLELPLFQVEADEEVRVEGEYPDGERYDMGLRPGARPVQLCGNLFRFSSRFGLVRLGFPSREGSIPEVLPVRFRPIGERFLFLINPRGGYSRARTAAFTGVREHFLLTIDAEVLAGDDSGRKSLSTSDRR